MTKNQIPNFLLYQRPLFLPAQYTRGKKGLCNCNGRKSPLQAKQTRNKAEQNGPIIEPL